MALSITNPSLVPAFGGPPFLFIFSFQTACENLEIQQALSITGHGHKGPDLSWASCGLGSDPRTGGN